MAKKKTDYIEEEGVVRDDDDYVGRSMECAHKILEGMAQEEEYQAMVQERRWATWEQASRATQHWAAESCKIMKREFQLRVVQVIALFCICIILIAK